MVSLVEEIKVRATELGGDVENSIYTIPILNLISITNKVKNSKNEEIKRAVFDYHVSKVFDCYLDSGQKELAINHAETALLCGEHGDSGDANNLGYVLMAGNKLESSKSMLLKSISISEKENEIYPLPIYNLAILIARENKIEESLKQLMIAKEKAQTMPEASLSCSCLFVPVIDNQILTFNEVFNPNLLDVINEAISTLSIFHI